ncbi:MAG: HEAT repeat domain-containing protein [Myxococcaceae bacterium]|nr:MAG: HEAT repeat domain-containing protein [Myxococcaceae bacterium]
MRTSDPGDHDDLPEVPDVPDEPSGDSGAMISDDEAVRRINRRVSPVGWLGIIAVLGVGGGTGYYMLNTARQEQAEADALTRGRAELTAITERNLPNAETARLVREVYARNTARSVRQTARRLLAQLSDPESVPMLIDGLAEAGAGRKQAALGLAEIGLPAAAAAKPALLAILPTADPATEQLEIAWALVVLQEPQAWPVVRQLLEQNKLQTVTNLDGRRIFDPALVARMAGRERLHELVTSRSVTSLRLAALSLAEIGTPDVLDDLNILVQNSDVSISREAAIGLGRTGDPRAAEPLVRFLNAHPDAREGVLSALAVSSGAQGLGVIIHSAQDLPTRATATRLLRDQRDPDAGDALFEALGIASGTDEVSVGMKRNAVFGLAEIGDPRAVESLLAYATHALTHTDPNSTSEAKQALDLIRQIPGAATRAKEGLLAIIRDPHGDFVRTPSIIALSRSGDTSVAGVVAPFLTQPDAMEGAAVALCALHSPECASRVLPMARMPANLRMVEETVVDEPVLNSRRTAIRALSWMTYGSAPVAPAARAAAVRELRRIVEDPNDRRSLREEAGYTLAAVADDAALADMAAKATDTHVPEEARIYYIYALRGRATPEIATRLVQTYLRRGTNPDVMRGAAIAAGFGANEATSDALIPLLQLTEAQDSGVRFAAAIAVVLGGNARAANALLDVLVANDELAGMMQNEFAPRGAGGGANNATVQENWSLLPLTAPMFEDGRVFRRIEVATILEAGKQNKHYGWAVNWLTTRLKSGWDNAMGVSAYDVRRLMREAALGNDAFRRDMAFRGFRVLLDRGSLHALRRQTRVPAASERARHELMELSGGNSAAPAR